jgi:hypothetical protein
MVRWTETTPTRRSKGIYQSDQYITALFPCFCWLAISLASLPRFLCRRIHCYPSSSDVDSNHQRRGLGKRKKYLFASECRNKVPGPSFPLSAILLWLPTAPNGLRYATPQRLFAGCLTRSDLASNQTSLESTRRNRVSTGRLRAG